MKIGSGPGESLPFDRRIGVKGGYPWCDELSEESSLGFGSDTTIDLGWYIFMLASEYKNLNESNQNAESTLIELYYALHALNRLDVDAEEYLSNGDIQILNSNLNGLLLRDDAIEDPVFLNNWEYDLDRHGVLRHFTAINAQSGNYICTGINEPVQTPSGSNGPGNVMTQDQLVSIYLTGLVGVKKMLQPQTEVYVPEIDEVINFHDYIANISSRIFWRLANNILGHQRLG